MRLQNSKCVCLSDYGDVVGAWCDTDCSTLGVTLWGHGVIQAVRRWRTEIGETQVDTRLRQRHGSYIHRRHELLQSTDARRRVRRKLQRLFYRCVSK